MSEEVKNTDYVLEVENLHTSFPYRVRRCQCRKRIVHDLRSRKDR